MVAPGILNDANGKAAVKQFVEPELTANNGK
jgi:hypothetical protein